MRGMLGTTEKGQRSKYLEVSINIKSLYMLKFNTLNIQVNIHNIIIFRPQSHINTHLKTTFTEHTENENQLLIPNFHFSPKRKNPK